MVGGLRDVSVYDHVHRPLTRRKHNLASLVSLQTGREPPSEMSGLHKRLFSIFLPFQNKNLQLMAQKYNHNVRHLHQFSTLLQFALTSPHGEYSTVGREKAPSLPPASASLLLLPYQSTAHPVCLRPLMDFTWQQAWARHECGPSLTWQPLALTMRGGGGRGSLGVL